MATVTMFQYTVETGQYDSAYRCLTPDSQAEITPTEFRWFIRLYKVEAMDVSVRKLISDAIRYDWKPIPGEPSCALVGLVYTEGTDSEIYNPKIFVEERDGEWLIDHTDSPEGEGEEDENDE